MDMSAADSGDQSNNSDGRPSISNADPEQLPSAESRSSNPHPNPTNAEMSLSKLAPPPDDTANASKESLISPDLRTDDDYSDEDDVDIHHNRSGTTTYNEQDMDHDEEEYDNFDDDDDDMAVFNASHRRTGSMAERSEQLKQQKEAMERKLRSLSQNLDQSALSIEIPYIAIPHIRTVPTLRVDMSFYIPSGFLIDFHLITLSLCVPPKGMDAALTEFQEMERINADKQIFSDLFDRIDPEENGDVDENEWISGLKRLNVGIMENDMAKLFHLMDGDKSGYIDQQDWITFCMQNYESNELQRLHDSVLRNVQGHSRKPSNMIHAQDSQNWSAAAVSTLEKQMTQALISQGVCSAELTVYVLYFRAFRAFCALLHSLCSQQFTFYGLDSVYPLTLSLSLCTLQNTEGFI